MIMLKIITSRSAKTQTFQVPSSEYWSLPSVTIVPYKKARSLLSGCVSFSTRFSASEIVNGFLFYFIHKY